MAPVHRGRGQPSRSSHSSSRRYCRGASPGACSDDFSGRCARLSLALSTDRVGGSDQPGGSQSIELGSAPLAAQSTQIEPQARIASQRTP